MIAQIAQQNGNNLQPNTYKWEVCFNKNFIKIGVNGSHKH